MEEEYIHKMKHMILLTLILLFPLVIADGYGVGDYGDDTYIGDITSSSPVIVDTSISSPEGSSCVYDKNYNWECSEWTGCINETQTRVCNERNNCGGVYGRPETERSCSIDEVTNQIEVENKDLVGEDLKGFNIILRVLIVIVVAVGVLWTLLSKNLLKKKRSERK